jgi:hypothetical protein
MKWIAPCAALIVLATANIAQAGVVELSCHGTKVTAFGNGRVISNEVWDQIYRVDLAAKRWCEMEYYECHPKLISETTPLHITLREVENKESSDLIVVTPSLTTLRGHQMFTQGGVVYMIDVRGKCAVKPISGHL